MQNRPIGNRSKFRKELSVLTNSLVDTLADAVLYVTFNALTSMGARTWREFDYGAYQADVLLCRYNSKTIRRAWDNLVKHRYIQKKKGTTGLHMMITQEGIRRINDLIPTYREKRPWDGYLYLVSYDIPVGSNAKRNLLREYLLKIGCGKLQDSLWMTPYNPTGIVNQFVDNHSIPGTILVSKLGKDGSIGDENRRTLIARVYGYEKLRTRYDDFLAEYGSQKHPQKTQLSIDYCSILKDDPQLPFSLEPEGFPAGDAYLLSRSLLSR